MKIVMEENLKYFDTIGSDSFLTHLSSLNGGGSLDERKTKSLLY